MRQDPITAERQCQRDTMAEAAQSFFTAGFPFHLNPLPALSYSLVPADENEQSDSEDELSTGQGMRLQPQLSSCERQNWPVIAHNLNSDSFKDAVSYWAKILILLDGADADPHFATLRRFFDARLPPGQRIGENPVPDDRIATTFSADQDFNSTGIERRSSFLTSSRLSRRLQWNRRPSLPSSMHLRQPESNASHSQRSLLGSIRRTSRRGGADLDVNSASTDACELWVAQRDDLNPKCIHFNVRLDLHNVHLAPSLHTHETKNAMPKKRSNLALSSSRFAREDTENVAIPSPTTASFASEDGSQPAQQASTGSRRSFVSRILDRGFRRPSHLVAAGGAPPDWLHNGHNSLHPYDPENAEVIDSDEECDRRESEHPRTLSTGPRRSSAGSNAARSLVGTHAVHSDLERVEEDSQLDSAGYLSSALRSGAQDSKATPPSEDIEAPNVAEGEDLLSLLRKASACVLRPGAQQKEPAWNRDADDALPSIISYAMAQAFGWEGIMHLCYGPGSLSTQEQVFSPLGRAADIDSIMRKKFDAVLSWRSNVTHGSEADDMHTPLDAAVMTPRAGDDMDSLVTGESALGVDHSKEEKQANAAPPIARHTLARTWSDWHLLFSSLFNWVSEYEAVRIRNGLSHEMGFEMLPPQQGITKSRGTGRMQPSPCVEADALQTSHGFQRLPGVPEALRLGPDNVEHKDYRWARSRLRVSHIQTPISTLVI